MASGGITPPAFATASKCRTGVVVLPPDTVAPGSSLVRAHVAATDKLLAAALESPPDTSSSIGATVSERPAAIDTSIGARVSERPAAIVRLLAAAVVPTLDADAAEAARGLLAHRSAPNAEALEPPPGTPLSPIEARVPKRPAATDRLLAAAAVHSPDANAAEAARGCSPVDLPPMQQHWSPLQAHHRHQLKPASPNAQPQLTGCSQQQQCPHRTPMPPKPPGGGSPVELPPIYPQPRRKRSSRLVRERPSPTTSQFYHSFLRKSEKRLIVA